MSVAAATMVGLVLLGNVFAEEPSAPPSARIVNLQTELSAPMFHGTVQAIDRETLRVTIRTDFGRLVPVAFETCESIQRLTVGDRVRFDIDAQGIVRALEKTDSHLANKAPRPPRSTAETSGRCPEPSI